MERPVVVKQHANKKTKLSKYPAPHHILPNTRQKNLFHFTQKNAMTDTYCIDFDRIHQITTATTCNLAIKKHYSRILLVGNLSIIK